MIRTTIIHDSDGEVLAPMAGQSGTFYRGKRENIIIGSDFTDEDIASEICEGMRGLTVSAIFTKKQLVEQCGSGFAYLPKNSRFAYREDVASALEDAGQIVYAKILRQGGDPLDFFVFEEYAYTLAP